jgi:hypothetical protein
MKELEDVVALGGSRRKAQGFKAEGAQGFRV